MSVGRAPVATGARIDETTAAIGSAREPALVGQAPLEPDPRIDETTDSTGFTTELTTLVGRAPVAPEPRIDDTIDSTGLTMELTMLVGKATGCELKREVTSDATDPTTELKAPVGRPVA